MSRVLLIAVLLVLAAAYLVAPTPVSGDGGTYDVSPNVDVKDVIYYVAGNYTAVFPSVIRVTFVGERDVVVHGWWSPLDDPAKYKYEVVSQDHFYRTDPPQTIEYAGAKLIANYFTSFNVYAYCTKTWWGYMEEHLKAFVTVYVVIRIEKPPDQPGTINLGDAIAAVIGDSSLYYDYSVDFNRVEPSDDQKSYSVSGSFKLKFYEAEVKFYQFVPTEITVSKTGFFKVGSLNGSGFFGIAPLGEVTTRLCLVGDPGFKLKGILEYSNKFSKKQVEVELDSGWDTSACKDAVLSDVVLIPGNYTGNSKFTVKFKSGAFTADLSADALVSGTMAMVSRPIAVATYSEQTEYGIPILNVTVLMMSYVDRESFLDSTGIYVSFGGVVVVDLGDYYRNASFICYPQEFQSSGVYLCRRSVMAYGASADDLKAVYAYINVSIRTAPYSPPIAGDYAETEATLVTPTDVSGLVGMSYRVFTYAAFAMLLAYAFFYVVNYFYGFATGRPFIDQSIVERGLSTSAFLAALAYTFPYLLYVLVYMIYSLPLFSQYLYGTPVSDPSLILSLPPDQVLALLMKYYDMTLSGLRMDYKLWFESELANNIVGRLAILSVAIIALTALAIGMTISFSSSVPGAVLSPLIGYIGFILSLLIMMIPMAGVVLSVLAIAEFTVAAVAVLFYAMLVLGSMLAVFPSPTAMRLAEDIFGAGFAYLLIVPGTAPMIYAMYRHVMETVAYYINIAEESLPHIQVYFLNIGLDLFVPITPIMRMTSYIAVASIISIIIAVGNVFLLTRTGLFSGLGEAILRAARR